MKIIKIFKGLFRKRVVVYTAIFGDYDDLKEPPKKMLKQCDFVCFTDNEKLKSDIFKIIIKKPEYCDNTRNAKIYKILPHNFFPEYEYSIWIDGSVIIKECNFRKIVNKFLKRSNIAFFKHPERDCIYDEVEACIKLKKDNPEVMIKQVDKYKAEGYPLHNGLAACTIIIRKHNHPEVVRLDEDWWSEIKNHSKRDQLSLNYVAWKNNYNYAIIKGLLWDNEYFKVLRHKK